MLIDMLGSDALAEGEMVGVQHGAEAIALYRIDGVAFATSNVCTHQYALMTDGYFDGKCIECPLHQGSFDVKTGDVVEGPVTVPLKRFAVEERDGRLLVEI